MVEATRKPDQPVGMEAVLSALAQDRPAFYSESDFKHALSWQIQQDHPP